MIFATRAYVCESRTLRGGFWGNFPRYVRESEKNSREQGAEYRLVSLRIYRGAR